MKIFYLACDIQLDTGHGGATHVLEVAENLAALGHVVHVFARGKDAAGSVSYHKTPTCIPRYARFLNRYFIQSFLDRLHPDILMERYYNFGGEGAWLKKRSRVPLILEVNSPMIEYRGSPKDRLDRILLCRPFERYRLWQARSADLIVTPLPAIIPEAINRDRIVKLPWGANTSMFSRSGRGPSMRARLGIPDHAPVAIFTGSFRKWHGAFQFVEAACDLIQSSLPELRVILIGDGETLKDVLHYAAVHAPRDHFIAPGRVPYTEVPSYMEAADIAVAPFNTLAHPYLTLGFFWSPLKIFEAMSMELPVVTIDRPELREIVGDGGQYYSEGDWKAMGQALLKLARDRDQCRRIGKEARSRVAQFSWRAHCDALAGHLESIIGKSRQPTSL